MCRTVLHLAEISTRVTNGAEVIQRKLFSICKEQVDYSWGVCNLNGNFNTPVPSQMKRRSYITTWG